MTEVIDNDFHPVDSDLSATDDHWGSLLQDMKYQKAVDDWKESDAGSRFYDTGTRIPGKQKGKNDNYMSKRK